MDQALVRLHPCRVSAENLPWPENSFDTVVSTFTLCSITRIRQTVAEIFRVLKPGGAFLFLEHGLSENPRQQKWQHRLNPLQKKLGAGCNLNRNIFHFVLQEPFETLELNRFELEKVPGILGSCYQGMLKKSK
jgi:SAM-dependent methyltransferase